MEWFIRLITFNKFKSDPEQTADGQLLDAAASGDTRVLSFLLQSDSCSVNATNKQGSTPLHLAIRGGHTKCVTALLSHPLVSLEKVDKWGRTPLHTALVWQRMDLLAFMIHRDLDLVNIPDSDGKTLLHYSCASGSQECVRYLISNKADLNAMDHRKWTPLMCAVSVQCVEIVDFLLSRGASCNQTVKTNFCTSALRLAIEKHNLSIVELLLENGALVEYTSPITLGSFQRTVTHRQSNICHNLATLAIENVELAYPASIDIAQQVVQASPSAPDEDACVKLYDQYIKPPNRLRRSMSRDLAQLIETISESTVQRLSRLLSTSFSVGVDLSQSNVDRLKRKFRLDEKQDPRLFDIIYDVRRSSLRLRSVVALRRQLTASGHRNIVSALNSSTLPHFIRELILLRD